MTKLSHALNLTKSESFDRYAWVKVDDDRPIDWTAVELDGLEYEYVLDWETEYDNDNESCDSDMSYVEIPNDDTEDIEQIREENHNRNMKENSQFIEKMIKDENPDMTNFHYSNESDLGLIQPRSNDKKDRQDFMEHHETIKAMSNQSWDKYSEEQFFDCIFFDAVDVYDMYDYEKTAEGYIPKLKCSESERIERLNKLPIRRKRVKLKNLTEFCKKMFIRTDYMISPEEFWGTIRFEKGLGA